ncbi:SulP family inorganic anion transporter [Terrabacter sp. Soil811]|uniref:SulP family inorganic anion transporter n=1 Tax=Terrabacter sp. Soil811 TaxID=1736419 RepID=UPI000AA32FCB|nr:SulP family inorganic anion transporter [Terrabacter sp. Soil811]
MQPFDRAYKGRGAFASATRPPITTRYVPFARSLAAYTRPRLRTDLVAGVTVAALALPSAMAYAELAGVPVSAGLYALLLPVLAYAVLGSAPRVVVGPEGTVSLLIATVVAPLAAGGSAQYAALASLLAIMVGVVFLAARLARLGWIADYFSQAVLVGYITGVAVVLILGQLGKLLGVSSDAEGAIPETVDIVGHLGSANGATVLVGLVSLALLVVAGRISKRLPGALAVVILGIAASWALDLVAHGVSVTGPVPRGLPSLELPDVSRADLGTLVVAALAVFLVAFSDSILTARSFAARHHEVVDANQELLAFGVAQISAGVTQSIPVGTSGSRTAVNDDMGATSQVSGLAAAGTIAVILLFLTAPIEYLPSAVLGAVIVYAAAKLIDPVQWRELARSSRVEVVIAAITVVCVVAVGVLQAIIVAVLLSVADIVRRAARPADAVLGWSARDDRYVDVADQPDAGVSAGVVVYRIQDRLFFANAHYFKRRLWAAVDGAPKPVRHVVLDGSFISDLDASAEVALREVLDGLRERNIELHVARAAQELRDRLDSVGLVEAIGADHFHGTVTAAVQACTH